MSASPRVVPSADGPAASQINEPSSSTPPAVLTDLPAYCWNHSTSYWHESRQSRNHRSPPAARHDLIGSRLDACNPLEPVWQNYLRLAELPWLRDHRVQGAIVFPAAGVVSAVVEAVRQLEAGNADPLTGVELREFRMLQALVIPDAADAVEVSLHLKRRKLGMGSGAGGWLEFSFYSCQDGDAFVEHACGLVQAQLATPPAELDGGREQREEASVFRERWRGTGGSPGREKLTGREHYDFFDSIGLQYGKSFQAITGARLFEPVAASPPATPGSLSSAMAFEATVVDTRSDMPGSCESEYLIHPTTLDSIWQATMGNLLLMDRSQRQTWVAAGAGTIKVSTAIARDPGAALYGICDAVVSPGGQTRSSVFVGDGTFDAYPWLVMEHVRASRLGASENAPEPPEETKNRTCAAPVWKPDPDLAPAAVLLGRTEADDETDARFISDNAGLVRELCRIALRRLKKLRLDADGLPSHLRKYVEWMREQSRTPAAGDATTPAGSPISRRDEAGEEEEEEEEERRAMEKLEDLTQKHPADGQLMRHVFASLDDIVAERVMAMEHLTANDYLSTYYKDSFGLRKTQRCLCRWFDIKAHKTPALRILEVGAGTGSVTVPILEQLAFEDGDTPRFSTWTFTDISAGWLEKAKVLLRKHEPRVEFKGLDIEVDPVEQGFEAESYDVVFAVNVFHATRDLRKTLENCRRLLKPGGSLVFAEISARDVFSRFIFGILPSWWSAEDRRSDSPLLREADWDEVLRSAGFSGNEVVRPDSLDVSRFPIVISTNTLGRNVASAKDVVVVLPDDKTDPTAALAFAVCRELGRLGARTAVVKDLAAAADAVDKGKTVVSLLEYERPFLEAVSEDGFERAKHLLLHCGELLWVTRSDAADGVGHPSMRTISGLLCCIKAEDPAAGLHELHFCRHLAGGIESAGDIIGRRLISIWRDGDGDGDVTETTERDGHFCIQRWMPDKAMNDSLARATGADAEPRQARLVQPGRPLKLAVGQPGMLDTLHWVDDPVPSQPLAEDEVEIEARVLSPNFRDIMIAMGQLEAAGLGVEAAGIVRRVGPGVTKVSPGDRVACFTDAVFRTDPRAREPYVMALPPSLSLEEGAATLASYGTAHWCLVEVGRLQKGESVLIHAGAGALGQAAIQVATMLGAEIYCTASTEAKKRTMTSLGVRPDHIFSSRDLSFEKGIMRKTNGRGVDVVVNSLAGEALRKSWACIAPFGRFVEVGKRDAVANTGLDMEPFLRGAAFVLVDALQVSTCQPKAWERTMETVMKLLGQGSVGLIQPITVHDVSDAVSVFRQMQQGGHTGKLVLRVTPESLVPVTPRRLAPLSLRPDASYLLVGGLGGLGRAQAVFMAERGARHLAFVSRSGAASATARDVLAKLAEAGVNARAYAGDVADKDRLREILADISRSMPPMRGVIHGAMALDDVRGGTPPC